MKQCFETNRTNEVFEKRFFKQKNKQIDEGIFETVASSKKQTSEYVNCLKTNKTNWNWNFETKQNK